MSKRILVVEDQEDLRAILRDFLSASAYTVIEAVDRADSVTKVTSERPDLVLMDIQLPVLDGYDDAAYQGAAGFRGNPDHCRQFLRHEGRRGKGILATSRGRLTSKP